MPNTPRIHHPLYQLHLTRAERARFMAFSRDPLDFEIALLRVINERQMARLASSADPEEQAALERDLTRTAVLIARLMQVRSALGQGDGGERLDEIAASLRAAFTRPEPPA